MKLLQLVDSIEYVRTNCYQHQLARHLERTYGSDHNIVTSDRIADLWTVDKDVTILCTIKIRNVYKHLDALAAQLGKRRVFIYEQDPWESFIDAGEYVGGYYKVKAKLPGAEFIVASSWWAKFIRSKGLPVHFCRILPLADYCNVGLPASQRISGVAFKGTVHPFRKQTFELMKGFGLDVYSEPSNPDYHSFMSWLRTRQSFLHDEGNGWLIDGVRVAKNCVVNKEAEVAAQGCFVLRDAEAKQELIDYGLADVPLIRTFENYEHLAEVATWVRNLPHDEADDMMKRSVEMIRKMGCFDDMVQILNTGC